VNILFRAGGGGRLRNKVFEKWDVFEAVLEKDGLIGAAWVRGLVTREGWDFDAMQSTGGI